MGSEYIIRLRCPVDVDDSTSPQDHYAIDVRLPLSCDGVYRLGNKLSACLCGRELLVLGTSSDPWKRS